MTVGQFPSSPRMKLLCWWDQWIFFTVTWERYDELLGCVSVLPETSKALFIGCGCRWRHVHVRAYAQRSGRWVLHTHVSVFIRIKSKNIQFYTVILDRKYDSLCNISKFVPFCVNKCLNSEENLRVKQRAEVSVRWPPDISLQRKWRLFQHWVS